MNDYRPEIDGLRAIAVLGVVLFHLKLTTFSGGFVGVDVFFVISGYLITRNIARDIEAASFSFIEFYIRRARRILPALYFTTAVTFVFGALWLPADEFRQLSKEAIQGVLSISNILYWRDASAYFAPSSDQLSLLHFWSLSLEEQFYLLWPAFIFLFFRRVVLAVALISIVSFVAGLLFLASRPQAVFFLMPYRIFEFGIGAILVFLPYRLPPRGAEALSAAGLIFILSAIMLFKAATPFPGFAALLPCLGTAAVIFSGGQTFAARLISTPTSLWLGAISYSLYLCHWPIIFFSRFIFGDPAGTPIGLVGSCLVMLVIAWMMYRFIEQPCRKSGDGRLRTISKYGAVAAALVGIFLSVFFTRGWPWRMSAAQANISNLHKFSMTPCDLSDRRTCAFGTLDAPSTIVLLGDSYIQQYVGVLNDSFIAHKIRGEASAESGGCPMVLGLRSSGPRSEGCRNARDWILKELIQKPVSAVVIGQSWNSYRDKDTLPDGSTDVSDGTGLARLRSGIEQTIRFLDGHPVLLIGEQAHSTCIVDRSRLTIGPLWHAPNNHCPAIPRTDATAGTDDINEMIREIGRKYPSQVTAIIPADYFCDDTCPAMEDGNWLYLDSGHFTVAGANYMRSRLQPKIEAFLDSRATSAKDSLMHRNARELP